MESTKATSWFYFVIGADRLPTSREYSSFLLPTAERDDVNSEAKVSLHPNSNR